MYLHHFGLHSTPFSLSPHPEFFYAGARRGATLEALCYAILQGEGIVFQALGRSVALALDLVTAQGVH